MAATLYSVFVYLLTLLLMLFFNTVSISNTRIRTNATPKSNIPLLSILVFAVVFGIRYDVGIDHLRYIEQYNIVNELNIAVDTEIGYLTVERLFSYFDFHYSIFFTFIAGLQLFLICYALKDNYEVVGWMFVTFMLSTIFLNFMNGIRQEIAFCFQAVAMYYLSNRKFVVSYICIFLAICFHTSALLLLPIPLLYIKNTSYFNNIPFQVTLLFISIAVSILYKPAVLIFTSLIDILEIFGYDGYKYMVLGGDLSFLEPKRETGLGFIILIFMNLLNVLNSKRVKLYYGSTLLNIMYDLYFIGVIYSYIVSGSLILGRVNYYFYNFSFIISAFTMSYLYKVPSKWNKILLLTFIGIYFLVFCAVVILRGVESCAIYKTCF